MRVPLLVLLSLGLGCGARTALLPGELATEAGDGAADTESETLADTGLADTGADAEPDVPVTETGCTSDLDCDDGVACTKDACDLSVGFCRNVPVDARCDDGVFCNGAEACVIGKGCVTVPRDCADPVSCTVDTCDEASKSCRHRPDDALCPISHGCDPVLGCQARAIAHSATDLYEIRLPSGEVKKIGPTGATLTDIALHPTGTLYGVDSTNLCVVDLKTGACTGTVPVGIALVALDAAPDGTLYGAGGTRVYTIDRTTGLTKVLGNYPTGLAASGDIAFLGTRLLATARTATDDALVEFDTKTGATKILGKTGFRCIWGIAAYGPTLYGLTCEGRVVSLDPTTGKGVELTKTSIEFWGATAR